MNTPHHKAFVFSRYSGGYTLAELLASIAVLTVILVAIYAFEANVFVYNNEIQTQITNAWQAESVLSTMAKEIRTMVPSGNGSYPIASVSSTSITFFSNVDSDTAAEEVKYFYSTSTNTLYRGVIQPSGNPPVYTGSETDNVLVNGVRASSTLPLFQYFDGYYEGTSSPLNVGNLSISSIRLVRINLTVDTDVNRSPLPITYTTSVSIRNLKSNL
ncbi:MAG: hypothetical protein KGI59_01800 [Patescibacteria group bacterium]|nr:hypothetical protein [Patescibacteria group bacterium]MDE2172495.1 hypothetical protein [Patescibacteria group bacterium]